MPTRGMTVQPAVGSTPYTFSTPSNVTAGQWIAVAFFYGDDATTPSVNDATNGAGKDNLNNSWVLRGPVDLTVDGDLVYILLGKITVSGACTVRLLASSGSHGCKVVGREYIPAGGASFVEDQAVTTGYNAGSTTLSTTGQTPTTAAGVAVVGWGGAGPNFGGTTLGGGFGNGILTSDDFVLFGDDIYASTATLTPSATGAASGEWGGVLLLIQEQSGGGGSPQVFPDLAHQPQFQPVMAM